MYYCDKPFKDIYLDCGGQANFCSWLSSPALGNVLKDGLEAIWHSPQANAIRQTFLDESLSYCRKNYCPRIMNNQLERIDTDSFEPYVKPMPTAYCLAYDYQCNLYCPSCRHERIIADKKDDPFFDAMEKSLLPILNKHNEDFAITGHGDPFFSRHCLSLLKKLNFEKKNVEIVFETNGQCFTPKIWDQLENIHDTNIEMALSVDSLNPSVYRYLRRGGELKNLLKNIDFMLELREQDKLKKLNAIIVLQDLNFLEIPNVIETLLEKGFDIISIEPIHNWGTFTVKEFFVKNILNPEHPYHELCHNLIKPYLDNPKVFLWSGGFARHAEHAIVTGAAANAVCEITLDDLISADESYGALREKIHKQNYLFVHDKGHYVGMLQVNDVLAHAHDYRAFSMQAKDFLIPGKYTTVPFSNNISDMLSSSKKIQKNKSQTQKVFPILESGKIMAKVVHP